MIEKKWTFFDRLRYLGAIFFVTFPAIGLCVTIFSGHLEVIPILVLYVAYIGIVGGLICLLAQRLFQMHGVRKFRMGMFEMMAITSLLALPLGFARAIVAMVGTHDRGDAAQIVQQLTVSFSLALYMLIPIVFFVVFYTFGREERSQDQS